MIRKKHIQASLAMILLAAATALPGQSGQSRDASHSGEFGLTEQYSRLGADSCILCHDKGAGLDATPILATAHGARTDPGAPFADLQCESCHGPGEDHARAQRGGGSVAPQLTFGYRASTPATEQNEVCLGCHESHGRLAWFGSMHEREEVPCAACHQIHSNRDRVFDPTAQQEACFTCHEKRRSDVWRDSGHPLRFGEMTCSDCHDPHNGNNDFLLREATVNETCYTCHAEKRGPFLWEHAPASEDCTLCHRPHGSNHKAMLVKRPPQLCQQCHSPEGHPSFSYTPSAIEDSDRNRFLLGRSCLNCHAQPHGSNHPSGVTLHR